MSREIAVVDSPLGHICLEAENGAIVGVKLGCDEPLVAPKGETLLGAAEELARYFAGELTTFTVKNRQPDKATAFQKSVWEQMKKIPAGETKTYGEIAEALNSAPRAVGGACGRNPTPLLVPCHRVVAKNGLGGFSGDWETGLALSQKKWLLEHETKMSRG
jgi:methylated-DNA-[protein]-cysteine S-methyltransferase